MAGGDPRGAEAGRPPSGHLRHRPLAGRPPDGRRRAELQSAGPDHRPGPGGRRLPGQQRRQAAEPPGRHPGRCHPHRRHGPPLLWHTGSNGPGRLLPELRLEPAQQGPLSQRETGPGDGREAPQGGAALALRRLHQRLARPGD